MTYLGVEAICILGDTVQLWETHHVLLAAWPVEYAQSEWRERSKDLTHKSELQYQNLSLRESVTERDTHTASIRLSENQSESFRINQRVTDTENESELGKKTQSGLACS